MIPVLIVEGRELKVLNLNYFEGEVSSVVAYQEEGLVTYYSIKEYLCINSASDNKICFETQLIWKSKNKENTAVNKIKKRIESYEERMVELSFEHIKHSEPFAEKVLLKNEFAELEQRIEGLYEALKIIEEDSKIDA